VEANKKYRLSTQELDFGENPRGLGFEIAGSMSAGRYDKEKKKRSERFRYSSNRQRE
jgi:hypothetical protein